ncbi:endonuclease V, partial [Calditrichota bacterium]
STIKADIIFFDGHGLAHPRGLGIASHVGVLLQIPTVGCAKKKLIGDFEVPKNQRGAFSDLLYKGNTVGYVLRTKVNVKPIYISVGNMLILKYLPQFVLNCTKKYRIPEPTRIAHLAVTAYKHSLFS